MWIIQKDLKKGQVLNNNPIDKNFGIIKEIGEIYGVKLKCWNCDNLNIVEIPQGITVKQFTTDNTHYCENCNCELGSYSSAHLV